MAFGDSLNLHWKFKKPHFNSQDKRGENLRNHYKASAGLCKEYNVSELIWNLSKRQYLDWGRELSEKLLERPHP